MTAFEPGSTRELGHTRFIHPRRGRLIGALLNGLLRLTVKWRHGLRIDIAALRDQLAKLDRQAPHRLLAGVQRQRVDCNGVNAHWLVPKTCRPKRVLLYIHGGAFVGYTADTYAGMVATWCKALDARALMVDYRLAPESPHPAALQDCFAAYQWLLDQGVKPQHIVLAGDSAGGNLALATLQHLKQAGLPLPCCAALLSPFLDFTLSGASALTNARRDPVFTHAFAIGIRGFYASAEQHSLPAVSPLFGDFNGLPPLLLQVGSTEMLLDDAVRAAAKARAAGVAVQLEVWRNLPHVFQMVAALPQSREAARHICDFISVHAGWGAGR
ncbi:alpha/beta hydrolase [Pseudomonas sp. R16(2017)]|uniref:alpha/beta hydrolase n=1 Tax=Pseudomonas sp. R16(2017) TaxID=1981704 RepID=UPI000A1DEA11|nr:alpha/beta hydrolase [Pseudomonas sp. R16(2017)]